MNLPEWAEPPGRLRQLYDQVMSLPAAERLTALARLCPEDEVMRARMQHMLLQSGDAPPVLAAVDRLAKQHLAGIAVTEQPGDLFDDLELVEQIEEGAFGRVWRARQHAPLDRMVAVKVLKDGMHSDRILRRFETERRAIAQMNHPNIARVFGAGITPQGRPYFAMELVAGATIVDYCVLHQLPVGERLALFGQVCRAVHHAHLRGFVHRDLKPGNILVESCDGQPQAKVIDFGIAKALQTDDVSHTIANGGELLLGSLGYMSREQVESPGKVDFRADVYALGVILHEIVVGRKLLDPDLLRDKSPLQCADMMRTFEPTPPSRAMPCLSTEGCDLRDVDRVVAKALASNRDRRYATAIELAEDVERLRLGRPVEAEACHSPRRWSAMRAAWRWRSIQVMAGLILGIVATVWGHAEFVGSAQAKASAPVEAVVPLAPLNIELTRGDWHYFDSLYPPGDRARFSATSSHGGKFHERWGWTYLVLDRFAFVVDFWDGGDSSDLLMRFDPDLRVATGHFEDERGRLHHITMRR